MPLSGGGTEAIDLIKNGEYIWEGYINEELVFQPVEKLFFTTNGTSANTTLRLWFNQYDGVIDRQINIVIKQGATVLNDLIFVTGGGSAQTINLINNEVEVYIKCHKDVFDEVKQVVFLSSTIADDWGIDNVYPEIFPELDKLHITRQSQLTDIDWTSNIHLKQLEIYSNDLSGHLDVSFLLDLDALEFYNNDYTTISSLTNLTELRYFNSTGNESLTGTLDFTNSTKIHTLLAIRNNLTGLLVSGCSTLVRLETNHNTNLTQAFDFTSNPDIEVISLSHCPITQCIWNTNDKVKGFFIADSSIPEVQIHAGIANNIGTLEAVAIQSEEYVGPFNFNNATELHFLWLDDLGNCTGFSINNTGGITNLNIAGMTLLSTMPSLNSNPLNALLWVTGTGIGPTGLDALLNYISGLNIPPINEHSAGDGAIIYSDYETAFGAIVPTLASLAARNDLTSRGYTLI